MESAPGSLGPTTPNSRALKTGSSFPAVSSVPVVWRRCILIAWDAFAWILALVIFVFVRYDWNLSREQWVTAFLYAATAIAVQISAGLLTHVYLGRSRLGSFADATWIGLLVAGIALLLGGLMSVISAEFPRAIGVLLPPFALLFMAAGRWVFRATVVRARRKRNTGAAPALVYGAGDEGHEVARLVDTSPDSPYRIVGFLDDDRAKRFLRVRSYRVVGTGREAIDLARERDAEVIILAIRDAESELVQSLSARCKEADIKLLIVPPARERISGRVTLKELREINVTDLLGRRPLSTDLQGIAEYVMGRVVLITGAGGSIGAELANQVHRLRPSRLILLDRDESALHAVQLALYGSGLLDSDDMVLCDIRDYPALREVFGAHRPEVVFHAAALKHLPMLERFPAEGWKTNVLGTLNVLRCAQEVGVEQLVNVSTDKAADATSVLGQTKRLAERATAWYAAEYDVPYVSVRFGNVLGSRGSVLHSFRAQIERGGPIIVTHPEVTRFFMTIPEACELVLQAGAIGRPGDVLVLDMGEPVKIVDVARRLIEDSGQDIPINFTGLRAGEKLHEVLFSDEEHGNSSIHPLINQVSVPSINPADIMADAASVDVFAIASRGTNSNRIGAGIYAHS